MKDFFFSVTADYEKYTKVRVCGISLKLFKSQFRQQIETFEIEKIARSKFWDCQWYLQTYQHSFNAPQALRYWYSYGWKKGELPSKFFNANYLQFAKRLRTNPIILYESHGDRCFPNSINAFQSPQDDQQIQTYLAYKPTRQAKGVVYTCITNDYDDIRQIKTHTYIDKDWDYVCFTDNQQDIAAGQVGIWQIRPLQFTQLDNTRNNRYHKLSPHLLFPEYQESIYLDSNINVLTPFLFEFIQASNRTFVLPKHFKATCIYQEYQEVLAANLDDPQLIEQERQVLEKAGMPTQYGFCENNVLYRKHHDPQVKSLMQEWWNMVTKYSKRDQLSLTYLLWKQGIKPADITFENTRYNTRDFYVFGHKKRR